MGPKKKKEKKGKDDPDAGGGKEPLTEDKLPKGYVISRQIDRDHIDSLSHRVDELKGSNDKLRSESSKNEKDTHDIVLYFQREIEMKDDIINRLNEELIKRETQLKFEVEKLKNKFEDDINIMRKETENLVHELSSKLSTAESELLHVDNYVREKNKYDEKVTKLENNVKDGRQQMFDALEEQERKFLDEKSHALRELEEQKAAFKEIALKEARNEMSSEARRTMHENRRMQEELKFLQSFISDLQEEKATLERNYGTAKRDVSLLSEQELEYAKQAHYKTTEIKALRERVEHLEKQQIITVEKFTTKTKELQVTVKKELMDANMDAAGLRRLIKLKNQELVHMKSLAATILSQRTETEQFFLESLQEVKEAIKQERRRNAIDAKVTVNKYKTGAVAPDTGTVKRFPPLNIKPGNIHMLDERQPSSIPAIMKDKVYLKDLSWEDKELVLRVLFAKINKQSNAAKNAINMGTKQNNKGASNGMPPAPFFISEGVLNPREDLVNDSDYAQNFEINLNYDDAIDFPSMSEFVANDDAAIMSRSNHFKDMTDDLESRNTPR